MSRRHVAEKRTTLPDPKYKDDILGKFINCLMHDGKKSVAERIVYRALSRVEQMGNQDPQQVFHGAIENVKPAVEVRSRRVGGATYPVPIEVRPQRSLALALRWVIKGARSRNESKMEERLAKELLDASQNRGVSVKKREDTHRMADANKAFSHYRW